MADSYVSLWSPLDVGPYAAVDALSSVESYCPGCRGLLVACDRDGSCTGTVGALVPCMCLMEEHGYSVRCGCYIEGWPFGGGFTGWLPWLSPLHPDEPVCGPCFEPCPVHARVASGAAVTR